MKTSYTGNHGMLILAQPRSGLKPITPKTLHAAGSCEAFLCVRVWRAWTQAARLVIGRPFGVVLIKFLLPVLAMSHVTLVNAQIVHDITDAQATENHPSNVLDSSVQAKQWGLTDEQWSRYQDVMSKRRGVWSPGLDPLTALGVSADTVSERQHFAELYVRAEFERVSKELAFQVAVDRAWMRLYPDTPRLLAAANAVKASGPTERYGVVVSMDCGNCGDEVIKQRVDYAPDGKPLDIHVVGTQGDDSNLQIWITNHPWLREALRADRVTVNHGDQFADLAHFPVVYAKKEGGQWVREL